MPRIFIIIGGVAALIVGIIIVVVVFGIGRVPASPAPVTLEFWGIEDDEDAWKGAFAALKVALPHITVNYKRFDRGQYEERLINGLAEGKGPDVFMAPHTWALKHRDKLFPLPQEILQFTATDFRSAFVEGAADDMITREGDILGLPVFLDTPALFYNRDIFNASGIAEPPRTWEEAALVSQKLTRITAAGDVGMSGLALGTSKNIRHSFEIISTLILQGAEGALSPGDLRSLLGEPAERAFAFYGSFADPAHKNFSWAAAMPDSLDAFAQGKTAMMIGFSEDMARIRARNPHINLGVAPLPQFAGVRTSRLWGEYAFPAVSRLSRNREAAWRFIIFLSSREGTEQYLKATARPPARRDLISIGASSQDLIPFWRQSLIARTFAVPDERALKRLFGDAIDSISSRAQSPAGAVGRLREQVQLLLP